MTLIRLGKTREATIFSAEQYKAAVRKYMESLGYAQTTDSFMEGHLADMIFVPVSERPGSKEVWLEAKATKLSLSDRSFMDEICSYLLQWTLRTPASRFRLMVFVETLSNPFKWEKVWGNELSETQIREWLGQGLDSILSRPGLTEVAKKDVIAFFAETEVVEGATQELTEIAEKRNRVGSSALETRQNAQRLLEAVNERARPVAKKSTLLANLIVVRLPTTFRKLDIQESSTVGIKTVLQAQPHSPCAIMGNNKLLTLDLDSISADFQGLLPGDSELLDLSEVQKVYPNALAEIVNRALLSMMRPLGVRKYKKWYYFLARQEVRSGLTKNIETSNEASLQVARPFFTEKGDQSMDKPKLNFVFHQGFGARFKPLWNHHFIELRLKRLYSSEGATIIEGAEASRIDSHFRSSIFNRAETQENKLTKLADFLFLSRRSTPRDPTWLGQFSFAEFLTIPAAWAPLAIAPNQDFLHLERGTQ